MISLLKLLREAKELSQRQLSVQVGISNSRLCLIERGWVEPRPCELIRIGEALGVDLLKFNQRKPNP